MKIKSQNIIRIKAVTKAIFLSGVITLSGCSQSYQPLEKNSEFVNVFKSYVGSWQGYIDTEPGKTAPIVLHLIEENGKYLASIDSPYQQAFNMPLEIKVSGTNLVQLVNGELDIEFEGSVSPDAVSGVLDVRGYKFNINFKPQTKSQFQYLASLQSKKQTPKAPFSYPIKELSIKNGEHTLSATLTIPIGEGPFTTVVLLSGTGPNDRDYSGHGHKRFLVLADYLTRKGIAVVRFDKRGVGKSTGDFASANFNDFKSDVNAIVEHVSHIEGIDKSKIGLIGHSEGGMIAPLTATQNNKVAFVALLATMADKNLGLSLQYQQISDAHGFEKQGFVAAVKALEMLATSGASAEDISSYYLENYQSPFPISENLLLQTSQHFSSPSMRSFLSYSPKEYLSKITIPVLSVCGQLDHYFDCNAHSRAMKDILEKAGNEQHEHITYPNLNHYLQTAKSGTMAEESQLDETLSEQVLSDLASWVSKI